MENGDRIPADSSGPVSHSEAITPDLEPTSEVPSSSGGCLHELKWLGAGLVLSCFSLTFYRLAARRKAGPAILFLSLFVSVILLLYTVGVAASMASINEPIAQAFDEGKIPTITIEDGIATVDAQQPFVVEPEEGTIIILDTTGTYTSLDRSRYEQGMLLTKDSIHILNTNGRYQEMPLEQVQTLLNQNPMVIDREWALQAWTWMSVFVAALMLVMMFIWNMVVRAVYLGLIGLLIWAVVAAVRANTGFAPILITGLYTTVPAMLMGHLLERFGLSFFCLQYLLQIPFWGVALVVVLSRRADAPLPRQVPWHGWREWLAAPLLLLLVLDLLMFVVPVNKWVILGVTFATFSILIALSLIDRLKQSEAPRELDSPAV